MRDHEKDDDIRRERWKQEAAFFDSAAERADIGPVDPRVVARYRTQKRPSFSKEFRYGLLGNLAGLRILDVGCGDGENAITLAVLGASVVGIDVSPGAIDVCRRRAQINGVSDRTRFVCAPLEEAGLSSDFDVLWGEAILHHVIPDLDSVLHRMRACLRPGGHFLFSEPVNLSPGLRALRLRMRFVPTDATPDERPLERIEIEKLRSVFPELQVRWYRLFSRMDRFLLHGTVAYERAGRLRRGLVDVMARTDQALLSMPRLQRLAGAAVFFGTKQPDN
jgi:2-polyprenyl-3-methyl-5-hydroxy-6-metoxy-1,4-benzoquinol methylase